MKDRDITKTVEEVFDSFTMSHIYRLHSKGIIKELKGVVSSGKEARVYWGVTRDNKDVAVKIYLSFTAEFRKSIKKYIVGDPRFENIPQGNFRKLIYEWARKEFRNLKRLYENDVRVPRPVALSGNVIVMDFLGERGYRAPLLHEEANTMSAEEMASIEEDVAEQLRLIVCKAGLVHADLSEYNIMLWRGKPWIIDVSQAVSHEHPSAPELLERDIENLTRFFAKYLGGAPNIEEAAGDARECLEKGIRGGRGST